MSVQVTPPVHVGHSAWVDRTGLPLCVDVLGPIALRVDGAPVDVPGLRRRALLAMLALAGRDGISVGRLMETLWPDDGPDNAAQALYSHVHRLRRHLGPRAERLERHGSGYRLRIEPFELDADAARRLSHTDPAAALALWRGEALTELRAVPPLEVEAVALDELRGQLVDDVLESRLLAGDHTATRDAAAAAAADPLRERTTLLLVRALAVEGRTAEAMAVAHEFRSRLADEAGLDPTPALAELEQQVAAGSLARATWTTRRRVARPDGPMVGRTHDREEVVRLMGVNAVVTLTGPGGVGKTRLALDIAADTSDVEVVAVGLGTVERPDRVCHAVARSLDLRTGQSVHPADVASALAYRELLLLLDNCEHVVEACRELVAAVRQLAPGVRVLVTSRLPLQVPGEYVVRLQPLPVPRDAADLDALRRQPGVRAFLEHARRRSPGYELDDADARELVEVLRRLDGLPLGIELAARQVAVMPLRAVHARLDRALDLATGHGGPADERQRTLRATIDSSYRLLAEHDRALLRALAPFPGGVDLATVEALAPPGIEPLDLLHRLVDASLVIADAANARYRLLFTVRAYLLDLLVELGERDRAEACFVDRCVVVAAEMSDAMFGPDEAAQDRRLRAELDNLRAARDLADAEATVAITTSVERVVTWRDLDEIWAWSLELADDDRFADHPARATILAAAAEADRLLGDFELAEQRAREAIALADPVADRAAAHRARSVLAVVAHFRGDFDTARDLWLRASEDPGGDVSAFVGSAALASAYAGDASTARSLLDRARSLAVCGSHRAFISYVEGELCVATDPAKSIPLYLDAVAEAARVGCTFIEGVARVSLASARTRTGDVAGAADTFAQLIESWRRTGQQTQLWTTARNAAELLVGAGRRQTAALLLVSADAMPGSAAVNEDIARFSGRSYTPAAWLVGADSLQRVRDEASRLGATGVLDRALTDLRALTAEVLPQ